MANKEWKESSQFERKIKEKLKRYFPNDIENNKMIKINDKKIYYDFYIPNKKLLIDVKFFKTRGSNLIYYRTIGKRILAKSSDCKYLLIINEKDLIPQFLHSFLQSKNINVITMNDIDKINDFTYDFTIRKEKPKIRFKNFGFSLLPALLAYLELPKEYQKFVDQTLPNPNERYDVSKLEQSGFFVFYKSNNKWAPTTQRKRLYEYLQFQNNQTFIESLNSSYERNKIFIARQIRPNYFKLSELFFQNLFKNLNVDCNAPLNSRRINYFICKGEKTFFKLFRNYKIPSYYRLLEIIGQSYYFKEKYSQNNKFIGIFDGIFKIKDVLTEYMLNMTYFDEIIPLIEFNKYLRYEYGKF